MAERVDDGTIEQRLGGGEWRREGDSIVLDLGFADFAQAWAFASAVAAEAESANHHPDILAYAWNGVRITLSTHSAGGITDLDLELAARIDSLPGRALGECRDRG